MLKNISSSAYVSFCTYKGLAWSETPRFPKCVRVSFHRFAAARTKLRLNSAHESAREAELPVVRRNLLYICVSNFFSFFFAGGETASRPWPCKTRELGPNSFPRFQPRCSRIWLKNKSTTTAQKQKRHSWCPTAVQACCPGPDFEIERGMLSEVDLNRVC